MGRGRSYGRKGAESCISAPSPRAGNAPETGLSGWALPVVPAFWRFFAGSLDSPVCQVLPLGTMCRMAGMEGKKGAGKGGKGPSWPRVRVHFSTTTRSHVDFAANLGSPYEFINLK